MMFIWIPDYTNSQTTPYNESNVVERHNPIIIIAFDYADAERTIVSQLIEWGGYDVESAKDSIKKDYLQPITNLETIPPNALNWLQPES